MYICISLSFAFMLSVRRKVLFFCTRFRTDLKENWRTPAYKIHLCVCVCMCARTCVCMRVCMYVCNMCVEAAKESLSFWWCQSFDFSSSSSSLLFSSSAFSSFYFSFISSYSSIIFLCLRLVEITTDGHIQPQASTTIFGKVFCCIVLLVWTYSSCIADSWVGEQHGTISFPRCIVFHFCKMGRGIISFFFFFFLIHGFLFPSY